MNYDKFCKRCNHYSYNIQKGILCGLTNEKPDFEDNCDKFDLNPEKGEYIEPPTDAEIMESINKESNKNWPSKVSGWIGAFIGIVIWGSIGGIKGFIIGVIGGTICSVVILTPLLIGLSSMFNKTTTPEKENG